jgi:predicted nucleic acid-binding protein
VTLVIDASVALTWCFEDERRPETDAIGQRVLDETAIVPSLFHLELANILLVGERRKRITQADAEQRLERMERMQLAVDDETVSQAWSVITDLARSEGLTAYDAAYLELALRLGLPLATLDRDLAAAARRRGVTVLP